MRPYLRISQPTPPPRVIPPMPVIETVPPGVASPNACVSWSRSPRCAPPSARAVRVSGSTRTLRIRERSITRPPSTTALPAALCPPPRTATCSPFSRAKFTQAITSATPAQRAISAGCLSAIAFQTRRAVSYSGSSGWMSSPRSVAANSAVFVPSFVSVVISLSFQCWPVSPAPAGCEPALPAASGELPDEARIAARGGDAMRVYTQSRMWIHVTAFVRRSWA